MSLIGETIKIRREELGLDQLELGRQVGVGQQTVSRWETGAAVPKANRLAVLAEVLQLDSEYVHRMAGYLPVERSSAAADVVHDLLARAAELTEPELLMVIDRCWQEYRKRQGLTPPGTT